MTLVDAAGTFTEYPPTTGASGPYGTCADATYVYVVERSVDRLAKFDATGACIAEYALTPGAAPFRCCIGPDGKVYITQGNGWIGRINADGTGYTQIAGGGTLNIPFGITSAGGNVWFCEYGAHKVCRLTTAGVLTKFDPTTAASNPADLCVGPDGNLWFTEFAVNKIGVMSLAGAMVNEFTTTAGGPYGICSDGAVCWFVDQTGGNLGSITTAGAVAKTAFASPGTASPRMLAVDTRGNVWATLYGTSKIARRTTAGVLTEWATPGAGPLGICAGPDTRMWIAENGANMVTAVTSGPVFDARTPTSARVVVATAAPAGVFGAHNAFSTGCIGADGIKRIVYRKATTHNTYDGSIVMRKSSDNWASETTLVNGAVTGYDERDPNIVCEAGGRLVLVWGRRRITAGVINGAPGYIYSDDNGATWSAVQMLTNNGMYNGTGVGHGATYGSDYLRLPNGHRLVVAYGYRNDGDAQTDIVVLRSTDAGVTYSPLSYPASHGAFGFSCVEPQFELLPDGLTIYLTFHLEDGSQTVKRMRSTDGGATWDAAVTINSGDGNRSGLLVGPEGDVILGHQPIAAQNRYKQSVDNGVTYQPDLDPNAGEAGTAPLFGPVWISPFKIGEVGAASTMGIAWAMESFAQDRASVYYREFSSITSLLASGGHMLLLHA